mgnify:CR=1 FL=1|tara:strand:+ start:319 stop:588 length:270 start_codon:yes stop_codon:yes gene_type:complete
MEKLKKVEKLIIIKEMAPWFSPKELQELHPSITNSSLYHYCNFYGIPKSRENLSKHKQEFLAEYDNFIADKKTEALMSVEEQLKELELK